MSSEDKKTDAGNLTDTVTGTAQSVTGILGNTVGGLGRTVGGVAGAATRGLGGTVNSVTGDTGRPVGDAVSSIGTGVEGGLESVSKGVEDAGQWKKQ
ncbi:hypothetical protein J3F84DRAFT_366984 [Trichoderma pleuroticola]|uniref:Uncharacterized protein n=1 Tax=Trichoderma harzianum TaxID=5544 RepID=A0A2K0U2K4_TRIHA|nr:hypothetical protein THARTR1_07220 [Trichoderma harzianum]